MAPGVIAIIAQLTILQGRYRRLLHGNGITVLLVEVPDVASLVVEQDEALPRTASAMYAAVLAMENVQDAMEKEGGIYNSKYMIYAKRSGIRHS